jgi:uncharacterized protein (DUF302 family)
MSTLFDSSSYSLSVRLPAGITHEEAMTAVKQSFKAAGFGLPPGTTDLNMAGIFAKKGMEFDLPQMHVLGFCSPSHAFTALTTERAAALLLPCNVCVAMTTDNVVEVAAIEPFALLGIVKEKDALRPLVDEVRAMIQAGLAGVLPTVQANSSEAKE